MKIEYINGKYFDGAKWYEAVVDQNGMTVLQPIAGETERTEDNE